MNNNEIAKVIKEHLKALDKAKWDVTTVELVEVYNSMRALSKMIHELEKPKEVVQQNEVQKITDNDRKQPPKNIVKGPGRKRKSVKDTVKE